MGIPGCGVLGCTVDEELAPGDSERSNGDVRGKP